MQVLIWTFLAPTVFLALAISLGALTGLPITPIIRGNDGKYQAVFMVYQPGTDAVFNFIQ